jgi:hypothetical protein
MRSIIFPALLAATIATGAIIGALRQSEVRQLRERSELLRLQATEVRVVQTEINRADAMEIDWDELNRLRAVPNELARLRSEVGPLRQAAQLDPGIAEKEIISLTALAEQEKGRLEEIRQQERIKKLPDAAQSVLAHLLVAARDISRQQGRRPSSFSQIEAGANLLYGPEHHLPLGKTNPILGKTEEFFEFLPIAATDHDTAAPPMPILREREPRRNPEGGWVRLYGMSNFQIEEVELPENRFEEWEQAIMSAPGNRQR